MGDGRRPGAEKASAPTTGWEKLPTGLGGGRGREGCAPVARGKSCRRGGDRARGAAPEPRRKGSAPGRGGGQARARPARRDAARGTQPAPRPGRAGPGPGAAGGPLRRGAGRRTVPGCARVSPWRRRWAAARFAPPSWPPHGSQLCPGLGGRRRRRAAAIGPGPGWASGAGGGGGGGGGGAGGGARVTARRAGRRGGRQPWGSADPLRPRCHSQRGSHRPACPERRARCRPRPRLGPARATAAQQPFPGSAAPRTCPGRGPTATAAAPLAHHGRRERRYPAPSPPYLHRPPPSWRRQRAPRYSVGLVLALLGAAWRRRVSGRPESLHREGLRILRRMQFSSCRSQGQPHRAASRGEAKFPPRPQRPPWGATVWPRWRRNGAQLAAAGERLPAPGVRGPAAGFSLSVGAKGSLPCSPV